MKKLLMIVSLFLFNTLLYSQSGAKIEFKSLEIDYGNVTKGADTGIRYFEFTNVGDAPLVIKNVQSTCGCAIPSFSKEPILPGKSGKIEVKYNMTPGPIRKSIMVESNAINSENGIISLKIKGQVLVESN